MKKNNLIYDIGLDIGTGSVGYAVINEHGNLLKKGKKNLWGSRLFLSGKTAEERRLYRGRRRLLDRKKQRVLWLQEFFYEEISKVDPHFFIRIKESSLVNEDTTLKESFNIFNGETFDGIGYYEKYPTIYHLRKELTVSNEKKDIRLVYLALSHIVKNRGNFLYEGQQITGKSIDIADIITHLFNQLEDSGTISVVSKENHAIHVADILKDTKITKADKRDKLIQIIDVNPSEKSLLKLIYDAILGYKVDYKKLFPFENESSFSFSLSESESENKLDDVLDDQSLEIFQTIHKIYSGYVLAEILSGENVVTISDVMIKRYEKHQADLGILKGVYRSYFKNEYNNFFKNGSKNEATYNNYIIKPKDNTQEKLYKVISRTFENNPAFKLDKMYEYISQEMDVFNFLPKLKTTDNGVIPYQIQSEELKLIIEHQSKYYPFLNNEKEKIISLVEFRIPYYVGPLGNPNFKNNKFSWSVRKKKGEIYPWNFSELIDIDKSAEEFINRMRNKCTYLPEEDVVAKKSLLYSEYEVLNEINQITIDGKRISKEVKKEIIEDLFQKYKTISKDRFLSWLKRKRIIKDSDAVKVEGFQKENGFATSLTSYIDFRKILGEEFYSNIENIEKIILWITLFEDKKILKRKLESDMPFLTDTHVKKISQLNYSGWGRLSKKLLLGLKDTDHLGQKRSILDYLREENYYFMQLITSDKFDFKKQIDLSSKKLLSNYNAYDSVDLLPCSPAVKKSVWQSMKVVEELVKYLGNKPRKIFIEYTRDEKDKQRSKSRYDRVEELYSNFKANEEIREIYEELKSYSKNKKALDEKALYLYFIQHGKCLYSGKRLDLNSLGSYQIDHIIPRSYIKDDSFDNLALVYASYNQRKNDSLLLDISIRDNMRDTWTALHHKNFLSKKKYDNLTRDHFTENELKNFIERQIIETSQIVKYITNIFDEMYQESQVYSIKAALTSNLRSLYHLYKVRNINDYHHAHDAFLAASLGQYLLKAYPKNNEEFKHGEYLKYYNSNLSLKGKYGVVIEQFKVDRINIKTGEIYWNGENRIDYIRKALSYSDCFISKKVETNKGEFYKQTIYSPNDKSVKKLIPLKKGLDPSKYGGYISDNQSHCCVIEVTKGKKKVLKLIGIPMRINELSKTDPEAIHDYIKSEFPNHRIIKDHIKKYQKISYNGNDYYIVSSKELINAKQLIIPCCHIETIYNGGNKKYEKIADKKIDDIYEYLVEKLKKQYTNNIMKSVIEKLEQAKDEFLNKSINDKVGIINEILNMTQANSSKGDFKKYQIGNIKDDQGRMRTFPPLEDTIFIDSSVSGIFERRYKLEFSKSSDN